mmetsp:Transcript_56973/g.101723  ORF Transcript_56973/g.101723 Transcript_56973/m.101723 type:complete len:116 (-) Transcript_56973:584-931(-)
MLVPPVFAPRPTKLWGDTSTRGPAHRFYPALQLPLPSEPHNTTACLSCTSHALDSSFSPPPMHPGDQCSTGCASLHQLGRDCELPSPRPTTPPLPSARPGAKAIRCVQESTGFSP